ncbi:MAG: PH-like domain-containing protein [Microcella sp.]
MERLLPAALTISLMLALLALAWFGWRGRRRRQGGFAAPHRASDAISEPLFLTEAIAHATTLAGQPLERVTAHGLGYRSRIKVGVHDEGVVLAYPGDEPILIPVPELIGVGRGTWTIDKAVEPDGLTVVSWRLGDTEVDTWLRLPGRDDRALIDAVRTRMPDSDSTPDERLTDDA